MEMATAAATAALMTWLNATAKETAEVVVAMAAAAERVVMAAETLVASQISAAATTISTATAWTLVRAYVLVGRWLEGLFYVNFI